MIQEKMSQELVKGKTQQHDNRKLMLLLLLEKLVSHIMWLHKRQPLQYDQGHFPPPPEIQQSCIQLTGKSVTDLYADGSHVRLQFFIVMVSEKQLKIGIMNANYRICVNAFVVNIYGMLSLVSWELILIADTSQDAIALLDHQGTLLAHIRTAVNVDPQVIFHQVAFQPLFPKPVALHRTVVTQGQDLALFSVEPHTIGLDTFIQPVQFQLQNLSTLQQINTPTQLGAICKLTENALNHLVQIVNKDIKQDWPQY
ncbi:hypothetical protein WISP_46394 [Willisornis vidua]|uniref:Uncharacterized protein n=1 Tax=Willisornis vidua TaxID=1566151 RepID=A0ABQ9DLB2_9PASS|nr:hypothetical protein WISP_46394 [Willisornis vidua]